MDVLNIILGIIKFIALLVATFYFMRVITSEDKKLSIVRYNFGVLFKFCIF